MRRFLLLILLAILFCGWVLTAGQPVPAPQTDIYFTSKPEGQDRTIKERILDEIRVAKSTIDIAMYRFTDTEVIDALKLVKDKVRVRIILGYKKDRNLFDDIDKSMGFKDREELRPLGGRKGGIMHHKFMLFDGKLLMTGSYNITEPADNKNYENALFISDKAVIEEYQKEFNRLFEKAK